MSQIKNELTREYRAKRSQLDFQLRERESGAVIETLRGLPEWKSARRVLVYCASNEEVDTLPLVRDILETKSKELYVPFMVNKEEGIGISGLSEYAHLAPGMFGILEPRPQYRGNADPAALDVVVVPGIVFDRRGGRIGYGHGYYDRLLKKTNAVKIGLAYELQLLNEIPQHSHDVHMDIVLTASEIIRR